MGCKRCWPALSQEEIDRLGLSCRQQCVQEGGCPECRNRLRNRLLGDAQWTYGGRNQCAPPGEPMAFPPNTYEANETDKRWIEACKKNSPRFAKMLESVGWGDPEAAILFLSLAIRKDIAEEVQRALEPTDPHRGLRR